MNLFKFLRWISVLLVYPIVFIVIMKTQIIIPIFNIILGFIVLILLVHIPIICIFKKISKREKKGTNIGSDFLSNQAVELVMVAKNEGGDLFKVVKHYLAFHHNFKITLYDDNSDDGSYERLVDFAEKTDGRLKIKRLKRTNKTLHPKGMGVEDFIQETESDFILINDADTIVYQEDFENALRYLIMNEYDVVHLSRRNDLNDSLVTRVSDTEEMNNTAMKVIKITDYCFPGSGILLKTDAAKLLDYSDFVPGDDLEMGRQLKEAGKKLYHFQTLFVHEKAPSSFKDFFNQRAKWCRNIAYHLFENEKIGTYIQNIGAAFAMFFAFGLFSPLSYLVLFIGFSYTMLGIYSNVIFAGRSFGASSLPSIINTFQLWLQAAVFTPFYMIYYPVKRKAMDYKKSKV